MLEMFGRVLDRMSIATMMHMVVMLLSTMIEDLS